MSAVAVLGCTIEIDTLGVEGNIHVTLGEQPSSVVLIDNKGVWFDKINVTLDAGATYNGGTLSSPATWDITGTASNVLSNDEKAVQEGDNGTSATLSFVTSSTPPVTYTTTVKAKVSSANQDKVIAS